MEKRDNGEIREGKREKKPVILAMVSVGFGPGVCMMLLGHIYGMGNGKWEEAGLLLQAL